MYPAQKAFADHCELTYAVGAAYPKQAASRAFGVYDEDRETDRRVTFVIDKAGMIRHVIDEPREMERHSKEALEAVKSLG